MRNSANNSIDVTGFSFDQMQKIFEFMSNGGRIEHVVVGWCYIDGVESEINMLINSRTGYEFLQEIQHCCPVKVPDDYYKV